MFCGVQESFGRATLAIQENFGRAISQGESRRQVSRKPVFRAGSGDLSNTFLGAQPVITPHPAESAGME